MSTPVYLIRHAKAGHRERWREPDHVRPLTKPGWRQAEALVETFADVPFARLVSSPYVRCVQTLEPLGRARGLDVESAGGLEEGTSVSSTFELISAVSADGPVALCTHGDVMENVLDRLDEQGVPLAGPVAFEKGCTWVLDVADGQIAAARYVPPPDEKS